MLVGAATPQTAPIEHVTDFEYDDRGNLTKQTENIDDGPGNAEASVTQHIYDIHGLNRVQTIRQPGDANLEQIAHFAYDDLGRVVATTDAEGHTAQMTLNGYGQPLRVTDLSGGVTVNVYDKNRRLSQTTAPNGAENTLTYITPFFGRNFDRVATEIDSLEFAVTHEYDAVGNRVATTDRNGNTTRFRYDELDRLTETVDALGNVTRHRYDGNGNRVETSFFFTGVDGATREHTIFFRYDVANRLVLENQSWVEQDAHGQLALGPRATRFTYDDVGNLAKEERGYIDSTTGALEPKQAIDAFVMQDETTHGYDERNRRISTSKTGVFDAQSNTHTRRTELVYDSLGRVLETIELTSGTALGSSPDPGEGSRRTRLVYDLNGNVTDEFTDERVGPAWQTNRRHTHEYDDRNLRIKTTLVGRTEMATDGTTSTVDVVRAVRVRRVGPPDRAVSGAESEVGHAPSLRRRGQPRAHGAIRRHDVGRDRAESKWHSGRLHRVHLQQAQRAGDNHGRAGRQPDSALRPQRQRDRDRRRGRIRHADVVRRAEPPRVRAGRAGQRDAARVRRIEQPHRDRLADPRAHRADL